VECVLTIIGHIDVHKRPQGFPEVIKQVVHVDVETKQQLLQQIEGFTNAIINMQGMAVRNDPAALQDFSKLDLERMWVPMHMITHINAEIVAITGETPTTDPDGKLINKAGKEAIIQ
jgi:hypothetical protein